MMSLLRVKGLSKYFGPVQALDQLSVDIEEGEFFTLLGPSGCGKTTTLRIVAGLEKPDDGEIYLGDRCLVSRQKRIFIKPENRQMGMVFQSYAVWPHMTVFENVAYPLRLRGVKKPVIRERVKDVLSLVGLAGLEDRPAPALSGGQQQRVALARAMVFSPGVLLLDEPLSNLDAQLREEMRRELKLLQQRLKITVLFVTHDQLEALSLSDKIGIMNAGKLQQVGSPQTVYFKPRTPFVRDFLGKTVTLTAQVSSVREDALLVEPQGVFGCPLHVGLSNVACEQSAKEISKGREVLLAIRPEQIEIWACIPSGRRNVCQAKLESVHFLGDRYEYTVSLGSERHVISSPVLQPLKPGQAIYLELKHDALTLWPLQ